MNWRLIEKGKLGPVPGSRVLVFTPTSNDLRYRLMDAELLHTASDATHWHYLEAPKEYWAQISEDSER